MVIVMIKKNISLDYDDDVASMTTRVHCNTILHKKVL